MPEGAQDFSVKIEHVKNVVREHIAKSILGGSIEGKIYWFTRDLEEKMAKKIALSDVQWQLYGHIRFLFGENSLEDLRAAGRAYKKSLRSPRTQKMSARFLEEVIKHIRSVEDQSNGFVRLWAALRRILFPNIL